MVTSLQGGELRGEYVKSTRGAQWIYPILTS